jgi:protein O-mannosyl-transferase
MPPQSQGRGSPRPDSGQAEEEPRNKRFPLSFSIVTPIVVAIVSFLAFFPALSADFVNFDDGKLFLENPGYRGFSSEQLAWMFTTTYMGHNQPLTWLSHAIDYKISGVHPSSYHRNNLILHALNAVLVYFLAMKLISTATTRTSRNNGIDSRARSSGKDDRLINPTQDASTRISDSAGAMALRIAAAVTALLFAVHPLRVESVAWASERRDVLSMFFLLAATLAFLRSVRPAQVRLSSWPWYVGSLLLLICSLLAKAWGMSFFVMMILLSVYPLGRLPWRIRSWLDPRYGPIWLRVIPFFILGVLAAVKAGAAQHSAFLTMKTLDEWGIVERITQAFYGLAFYFTKTVWPTRLAVLYELPRELNPFEPKYLLSTFGVVIGLIVLWTLRKRVPALFIAGIAYAVWLAPVLGFAQSGPQLVADRYSYVSCLGWVMVAGGALYCLWKIRPTATCYSLSGLTLVIVLASLFTATVRQTRAWENSESLWAHAVAVGADSTIANRNHALDLSKKGDLEGAIRHLRKAIELNPSDGNAWFILGQSLRSTGKYPEAEEAFLHAVELLLQKHLAFLTLGEMYLNDMDQVDDAIAAFHSGIVYAQNLREIRPAPAPRLFLNLGIALRARGDFDGAKQALEAALRSTTTRTRAAEELRLMGFEPE